MGGICPSLWKMSRSTLLLCFFSFLERVGQGQAGLAKRLCPAIFPKDVAWFLVTFHGLCISVRQENCFFFSSSVRFIS